MQQKKKKNSILMNKEKIRVFILRSQARGVGWSPARLQDWHRAACKASWTSTLLQKHPWRFPLAKQLPQLGINTHTSLGEKPLTGRQTWGAAEVGMAAAFAALQTLLSCQEFTGIILNELWSRKISHLAHLNDVLESPLLQIYSSQSSF